MSFLSGWQDSRALGGHADETGTDQPAADRSTSRKACLTLLTGPASRVLRLIFWNTAVIDFVENGLCSPSTGPCVTLWSFVEVGSFGAM